MNKYSIYTIEDLQRAGFNGDTEALCELGKRVLNFHICEDDYYICEHKYELNMFEEKLNEEVPPDCPKCGYWLTDV